MANEYPQSTLTKAFRTFWYVDEREQVWEYRDYWIHNKPKRIETVFDDPAYDSMIDTTTNRRWQRLGGMGSSFEISWEDYMNNLTKVFVETGDFIDACCDEWERRYTDADKYEIVDSEE